MNKKVILSAIVLCLMGGSAYSATSSNVDTINSYLEKNDYNTADRLIYSDLSENGSNLKIKVLSAISLIQQGKLDSAQDVLDSVKKSSLDNADYYYAQGIMYLKRIDSSDMRFRAKKDELIQLSINQLEYSLKINPNNAKVYNAIGVAELKRDNLFKAQTYFEKAIKLKPTYAVALDNLGSTYFITGDFEKANQYYKKALASNPASSTVYYHLAQIALKEDDLNKALYYANKSLLWNKRSTYATNLIGEVYKKQGNEAAAIAAFKKATYLMPENPDPYINLACIYEARGDVYAAIHELKTCLSITPNSDVIKLNLANLLLSFDRYDDAIKYYSELSDKYKNEAVNGLVSAYYSLATDTAKKSMFKSYRRLTDSMIFLENAIKQNPDNLELYLTKSKLEKLLNNGKSSEETLAKLISSPYNNIGDYLIKSEAFVEIEDYKTANELYDYLVSAEKSVDNNLYLAEYFTIKKQYKPAKEILTKILATTPENTDASLNLNYINNMIALSDENYANSLHFKKHRNKFFQKVYLKKALKINPNNLNANIDMAALLKKEHNYEFANNCYKRAIAASSDEKQIKKLEKESNKLDKKIAKIESKNKKTENILNSKNIVPVNNSTNETQTTNTNETKDKD